MGVRRRLPDPLKREVGHALAYPLRWYVRYFPGSRWKGPVVDGFLDRVLARQDLRFVTRTRNDLVFAGSTRDIVQRHLYEFGIWEPNLSLWLSERLRSGDGFVDVGANVGYFSALASRVVGTSGAVVAVEAAAPIFALLEDTIRRNGCSNVRALKVAASDQEGWLSLFHGPDWNVAMTSTVPGVQESSGSERVRTLPLAKLMTAEEVERTRIVKIDVEGAELDALRGLEPALPRMRHDLELVVEVAPERLARKQQTSQELIGLLERHGFRPYVLANDYTPSSYVSSATARPVRLAGAVAAESDIVFSRIDAPSL